VSYWGEVWEGGCAPPRKKINLGLKYTICGAFRAFFQFSLAGFNANNVLDDLDYLLIFY